MFSFIRNNPVIALTVGAIVTLLITFTYVNENSGSYIINPLEFNSDTHSYLSTIEYFRTIIQSDVALTDIPENPVILTRALTTPLMMFAAFLVGTVTDNDGFGLISINIIFYLLLVPVFYRISMLLFAQVKTAVIATALLMTNWVLFTFGPTYLVDMGGWFFFLLTTMCALAYYRAPKQRTHLYAAIAAASVGVFFKEYGALGLATLGLLICIGTSSLQQKAKDILLIALCFGTILVSYHLWFYLNFNYSYFGWYGHNYTEYGTPESVSYKYEFSHLVRVLVLIFLPGWPLFLAGLIRFWRERTLAARKNIYILAAMLPASLAFLAWPAFTHRIAFILIPWIVLVAAYGISRIQKGWIIISILLAYAVINFNVDVLTAAISIP